MRMRIRSKKDLKGVLIMFAEMLVIAIIFSFISKMLPRKTFVVLILICLSALMLAIVIRRYYFKKTESDFIGDVITCAAFVTWSISLSYKYYFLNKGGATFWSIAIFAGITAGLVVLIVNKSSGKRFEECLPQVLVYFIIVLLLVYTYSSNLNYVFDDSAVECCVVIEDKDYINRRKGRDKYEFIMTVDGEYIELDVGSSVYHDYEIGDTYRFTRYEGAFGIPFYLAGTEE